VVQLLKEQNLLLILVFVVLWVILVYSVTAHWAWSADGWLFKMGVLDLAGGTVIHISAGSISGRCCPYHWT
jgi:ammonia channel protein AmtB